MRKFYIILLIAIVFLSSSCSLLQNSQKTETTNRLDTLEAEITNLKLSLTNYENKISSYYSSIDSINKKIDNIS
jgi:peptidoglycan hydrolase CwlO-like protein